MCIKQLRGVGASLSCPTASSSRLGSVEPPPTQPYQTPHDKSDLSWLISGLLSPRSLCGPGRPWQDCPDRHKRRLVRPVSNGQTFHGVLGPVTGAPSQAALSLGGHLLPLEVAWFIFKQFGNTFALLGFKSNPSRWDSCRWGRGSGWQGRRVGWGCLTRETGRKGTPLLYPGATPALLNLEKQQPGPLASGRAGVG